MRKSWAQTWQIKAGRHQRPKSVSVLFSIHLKSYKFVTGVHRGFECFTLDNCKVKINFFTVICKTMRTLKQWDQIAVISRYCLILILRKPQFFIILHHIHLFYIYKLRHLLFGTFKLIWHLFSSHWVVYLTVLTIH